jgi:hypothetical protein
MTKYNWAIVPSEVEFLATDSNGCVFGYDAEPIERDFVKFMHTSDFLYFPHNDWMPAYPGNWRESLEKRPEAEIEVYKEVF